MSCDAMTMWMILDMSVMTDVIAYAFYFATALGYITVGRGSRRALAPTNDRVARVAEKPFRFLLNPSRRLSTRQRRGAV